jgi:hypothetical protein
MLRPLWPTSPLDHINQRSQRAPVEAPCRTFGRNAAGRSGASQSQLEACTGVCVCRPCCAPPRVAPAHRPPCAVQLKKCEDMPTKLELYARIAGAIKAVPTKLGRAINAVPTKLGRGINLISELDEDKSMTAIAAVKPKTEEA